MLFRTPVGEATIGLSGCLIVQARLDVSRDGFIEER